MPYVRLVIVVGLWIVVFPRFLQPGEDDDNVGLNHFRITEIPIEGRINNVEVLDINQDGLQDIFITSFVPARPDATQEESGGDDKTGERSSQQALIFLHKKGKGLVNQADFKWKFDPLATALVFGNFLPQPGVEIGYFTRNGISVYPFNESGKDQPTSQKLLDKPVIFTEPQSYSLPVWQKALDIDNNGYDDLIIPSAEGYQICFQEAPGGKFTATAIDTPAEKTLSQSSISFLTLKYSLPNILLEDINNDKVKDVILFKDGELRYYLQSNNTSLTERFSITPSGRTLIKTLREEIKPNELTRASVNLIDVNRDGLVDLVISLMQGGFDNLDKLKTQILLFLGRINPGTDNIFSYPETADQVINLKGVVPFVNLEDVNEDGKPDLISSSFQMDFSSNLQKAVLRYLQLTYQIQSYQDKTGKFSFNPDYERTINFPLELMGKGRKYFSHIYFKDFNGDGRPDLLTISGPDKERGKLNIRPARPRKELANPLTISFTKDDYLLYRLEIPSEVNVLDLNADKKNDIVLRYRSRVITFISR